MPDDEFDQAMHKAAKPPAWATNTMDMALVGRFLHTRNHNGSFAWQGRIVERAKDGALVQLYSWLDGGPTKCVLMTNDELKRSDIYLSASDMRRAAHENNAKHYGDTGTFEDAERVRKAFLQ